MTMIQSTPEDSFLKNLHVLNTELLSIMKENNVSYEINTTIYPPLYDIELHALVVSVINEHLPLEESTMIREGIFDYLISCYFIDNESNDNVRDAFERDVLFAHQNLFEFYRKRNKLSKNRLRNTISFLQTCPDTIGKGFEISKDLNDIIASISKKASRLDSNDFFLYEEMSIEEKLGIAEEFADMVRLLASEVIFFYSNAAVYQ